VKANFNLKIQEVETKVFQLFWLLSNFWESLSICWKNN